MPLTIAGQSRASFSANAQKALGEESDAAAIYYLAISLASGTLTYRVSQ